VLNRHAGKPHGHSAETQVLNRDAGTSKIESPLQTAEYRKANARVRLPAADGFTSDAAANLPLQHLTIVRRPFDLHVQLTKRSVRIRIEVGQTQKGQAGLHRRPESESAVGTVQKSVRVIPWGRHLDSQISRRERIDNETSAGEHLTR